ncbi:hypothetical protein KVT40_002327 [Elsinoe batatas]|uniref:FAD-binding domain-containing protein n=1 Tax=Elsinoe batatas TaxID=2601811 RepID=A0A8K0L9R3_9PEZI|nr:hypothetical protein KVT40_002327 [Elsinoe batatas]
MSPPPLSIIGAGLGGLTLARSLLKRGVPAVIYDRSASAPRHGYGMTLHASTYTPLAKVLDIDIATFRQRTAVDAAMRGSGTIDPTHLGQAHKDSFRANRQKLELLLREGLDIRWEHQLNHISPSPSSLTLHFSNTTTLTVPHLIASDGPHSRARLSLLPTITPAVHPTIALNGKRRIPLPLYTTLYAPLLSNKNFISLRTGPNNALLTIQVNDHEPAKERVSISWIYSRARLGDHDPLHRPDRPNSGAEDIPEQFYEEIRNLEPLDGPFKDVFDTEKLKNERVLSWLMRTVEVPLQDLKAAGEKGVWFIGDAVHAEPILGGEGANAAITDGVELGEWIAEHGVEGMWKWYEGRWEEWRRGVERSKQVLAEMHSVGKASL